jgi:hypothetical protein
MPDSILLAAADGALGQWGLQAGASKVAAVQTADGDTSYIRELTDGHQNTFIMDALPGAAQSVTGHVVNCNSSRVGSGTRNVLIHDPVSGNSTHGDSVNVNGYLDHSSVDLADPEGGSILTATRVAELEVGVRKTAGSEAKVTYLDWTVTWVAGGGGIFLFVSMWAGWMIASRHLFGAALERNSLVPWLRRQSLAHRSAGRASAYPTNREDVSRLFDEWRRAQCCTVCHRFKPGLNRV